MTGCPKKRNSRTLRATGTVPNVENVSNDPYAQFETMHSSGVGLNAGPNVNGRRDRR